MAFESEIEERLDWLERAVTKIAGHASPPITLPPRDGAEGTENASDAVRALATEGRTIEAIKEHQLETGADLTTAKSVVESL